MQFKQLTPKTWLLVVAGILGAALVWRMRVRESPIGLTPVQQADSSSIPTSAPPIPKTPLHQDAKKETPIVPTDPQILARIREFGSWEGKSFDNPETFVFVNGRYVAPPIRLRREGYTVWLNERILADAPPIRSGYQQDLPTMPPQLTADSTRKEILAARIPGGTFPHGLWLRCHIQWFFSHHDPKQAVPMVLDALRKLPFVKEVELRENFVERDEDEARAIAIGFSITTRRGEPIRMLFEPQNVDLRPYTADEFKRILELNVIGPMETLMQQSGIVLISHQPQFLIGSAASTCDQIGLLHDIMNSPASLKRKYNELVSALPHDGFDPQFSKLHVRPFVLGFERSAEFDARIEQLAQRRDLARWKYVPDAVPEAVPAASKNDPRLTPAGTVRAAIQLLESGEYARFLRDFETHPEWIKEIDDDYIRRFTDGPDAKELLIQLRSAAEKQPQFDPIEDTAVYVFDDRADPAYPFRQLPMRKVGHFWLIGY